ncbi:hypothetical protein ACIA8O_39815 [Kitasatospora sp. NPDC051853]|uniref:hypothetical protein n=1 Tax=Kitasatospora sp. NPDC051853 TaxID=3364058 RepID=UPI003793CC4A
MSTPPLDARAIVNELLERGFSQTDVARGLKLTAKGSGSYVGQIAAGKKKSGKLSELRRLLDAARRAGDVPRGRGRAATEARQDIMARASVERTPRQRKSGETAAVRRKTAEVRKNGALHVVAAEQALNSAGGGKPIAEAIAAYAQYNGRFALTIVGRFDKNTPFSDTYWTPYYSKTKRKPTRKIGPANVREANLGNRGRGYSAAEWLAYIEAAGSFTAALATWLDTNGYDVPTKFLRVTLDGWLPA